MKGSKEFLGRLLGDKSRIHFSGGRPAVIAVMGTDRGVGATYFCVAALNFLVNVKGLKAAMTELNMHPAAQRMAVSGDRSVPGSIVQFDRVQREYDRFDIIMIDISFDHPRGTGEFFRSDMRFLIGSLAPWKAADFMNVLENIGSRGDGCPDKTVCLSLAYSKRQADRLKRRYGVKVEQIPYIGDPLSLKPAHCSWFNEKMEVLFNNKF